MCKTATGCEIRDLAQNLEIQRVCDGFRDAKSLQITGWHDRADQKLKDAGIDTSDLLLRFESVWMEKLKKEREREEHKRKSERFLNGR